MNPGSPSERTSDPLGSLQRRAVDPGKSGLVERWFREKLGPIDDITVEIPLSGNGFSSQLYFVQLHQESERRDLVVRQEVRENATFPLHPFMQEALAMNAASKAGVPVPAVHWMEEDASWIGSAFYVMERMRGDIPSDSPHYNTKGWVLEGGESLRRKLWFSAIDAMATLARSGRDNHFLQGELFGTLSMDGFSKDIDRYLRTYEEHTDRCIDTVVYGYRDFIEESWPSDLHYGLSWGDARLPNMVFRDDACIAMIDWEMCSVAPPELDLAYLLLTDRTQESLGIPRPPGWPSHTETLDYYSRETGIDIRSELPFLMAVCALKLSVIHARMQACGHAVPPFDLLEPVMSSYLVSS